MNLRQLRLAGADTVHLLLLAMEFSWFFPWLLLFYAGNNGERWTGADPAVVAGWLFTAFALVLLARLFFPVFKGFPQAVALAGAVVSCVFVLAVDRDILRGGPGEVAWWPILGHFLAAYFVWWRGAVVGDTAVNADLVNRRFGFGAAALVVLVLVDGSKLSISQGVAMYLVMFFFTGLLAMILGAQAHLRFDPEEGEALGARRTGKTWMLAGLLLVAAILGLGILFSALVDPHAFRMVLRPLAWLSGALAAVVGLVAIPAGYAVEFLVRLISSVRGKGMEYTPPQQETTGRQEVDLFPATWHIPDALTYTAAGLAALAAAALAAALVLWTLGRRRPARPGEHAAETRESLWSWQEVPRKAGSIWRRVRSSRKIPAFDLPGGSPGSRHRIRLVYRRFLKLAARAARPRRAAETPSEYACRMGLLFPGLELCFNELTLIYEKTRYGGAEPGLAEADKAGELMARIGGDAHFSTAARSGKILRIGRI